MGLQDFRNGTYILERLPEPIPWKLKGEVKVTLRPSDKIHELVDFGTIMTDVDGITMSVQFTRETLAMSKRDAYEELRNECREIAQEIRKELKKRDAEGTVEIDSDLLSVRENW